MKKIIIGFVLVLFTSIVYSQNYISINPSGVNAVDQTDKRPPSPSLFSWKTHINMITYGGSSLKKTILNKKKREANFIETQAKVNLFKQTYNDSEHYPVKIID